MDHFHFNNGPFLIQQWTIVWVNASLIYVQRGCDCDVVRLGCRCGGVGGNYHLLALSPISPHHAPITYRSSSIAHSPIWGFSLLSIALSPIFLHHASLPITPRYLLPTGRWLHLDWRMMQALLTLTMVHSHFNNGPFPFQQWTILISTMDHCLS